MQIGFIGLGNMGGPMARNLAAAGHAVTGFDTAAVAIEGVVPAASAAEAARGRDAVITMLPSGAILRAVYGEIVPAGEPGAAFVDCSTVDVESARAAAGAAAAAGLLALDAPVSGGTAGAAAGSLTFMVGGAADAFETARPLFEIMGARAVHCGGAGAGQAAKICNNMILGVSMLGVCEAFALARKLGLDPHALYDVVSTSSGACWSVTSYCPVPGVGPTSPADHDYRPGFAAELMLKDLALSQQASRSVDAATPLGARAASLYDAFVAAGGKGRDFSAVLPWLAAQGHAGQQEASMSDDDAGYAVIHLPPGEGRTYALGAMTAVFKADEAETRAHYSVSEWWLEPGCKGPGAHSHDANDEIFYVIEGTASMLTGDTWLEAPKGTFLRIPAGTTHDFENRSAARVGLLNVFIPGGFERNMPAIVDWFKGHP